ncbi:MAG: flavin reductase family protein [Bryobacterales bacterium]|nr:flavin reductase family protein [Bryobacterales bacterium]
MTQARIQQQQFRRACGKFATGVTVITARDGGGAPHGMTANSFTSVSLDPPLVLVCIDLRTRLLRYLTSGTALGINVLRESQRDLSDRFSRPGEDRFGQVNWYPGETGAPLLPDVLATIEATVERVVEAGDHAVVLAAVRTAAWSDGTPLLYFNSGYQTLRMES